MWPYDSFSSQVENDGSPGCVLNVAGQGSEISITAASDDSRPAGPDGSSRPTSARCWGSCVTSPVACRRASSRSSGRCVVNSSRATSRSIRVRSGGNPAGAVEAVSVALNHAIQAARQMYRSITNAQSAINRAAHAGPDSDGTEPCCPSCRSNAD